MIRRRSAVNSGFQTSAATAPTLVSLFPCKTLLSHSSVSVLHSDRPSLAKSRFCGNHDSSPGDGRLPCPLDPSHSVSKGNLESHLKRCPFRKQALALESHAYYSKGINSGIADSTDEDISSSEVKRAAIHGLEFPEFVALVKKIESFYTSTVADLQDSYLTPDSCAAHCLRRQTDGKIPYQERHALQQASILGNMEKFGILKKPKEELDSSSRELPAAVEFGAGRGYLSHMLADSYGIKRIILVERRSYKLKAERSLRKNESVSLERLRIDIEDLDMKAVESLNGLPFLAVGKHLCGNATDLTVNCCLSRKDFSSGSLLQGMALATCCHHLCEWKHYLNRRFFLDHGFTNQDFYAIAWFSSWAVDADHSNCSSDYSESCIMLMNAGGGYKTVEETIRGMEPAERAAFGFKCKDIIDMGRLLWLREHGLNAALVKYVPLRISPENHLLLAKFC